MITGTLTITKQVINGTVSFNGTTIEEAVCVAGVQINGSVSVGVYSLPDISLESRVAAIENEYVTTMNTNW